MELQGSKAAFQQGPEQDMDLWWLSTVTEGAVDAIISLTRLILFTIKLFNSVKYFTVLILFDLLLSPVKQKFIFRNLLM